MDKNTLSDDGKKILDKISESSQQITLPESLSRISIQKMLEEKQITSTERVTTRRRKHPVYRFASLAAAAVLFIICITVIFPKISANNTADTSLLPGTDSTLLSDEKSKNDQNETTALNITPNNTPNITPSGNLAKLASNDYDQIYDTLYDIIKNSEEETDAFYYQNRLRSFSPESSGIFFKDAAVADYADGTPVKFNAAAETEFNTDSFDSIAMPDSTDSTDTPVFSGTNLQVEGVDESDIVKTDGHYIYVVNSNTGKISIIPADTAAMKTLSVIDPTSVTTSDLYVYEIYLSVNPDRLYIIATASPEYDFYTSKFGIGNSTKYYNYMYSNFDTLIITYDVSDKTNPVYLSVAKQQGNYQSSRLSDGIIYLMTQFYTPVNSSEEMSYDYVEYYIPRINDIPQEPDCIYIPERPTATSFFTVSSIDINNSGSFVDSKSILAGSGTYYVSSDNIYIASLVSYQRGNDTAYTEIVKFSYDKGLITPVTTSRVKGRITDQFAIDESNGYLRLVSTVDKYEERSIEYYRIDMNSEGDTVSESDDDTVLNPDVQSGDNDDSTESIIEEKEPLEYFYPFTVSTSNSLYILDEALNIIGSIENMAEDEQIYSARFIGNTGYFVTFRQTDPLFSVDLSDPANPVILGELKIPGFSEYLHPYNDHLLLGIGMNADPETGATDCIKLTMFDISDPSNVKEVHTKLIDDYYYSDAFYNHKAVLVSADKNVIGFSAERWTDETNYYDYLVYGYDEASGFYKRIVSGYIFPYEPVNFEGIKVEELIPEVSETKSVYIEKTPSIPFDAYTVSSIVTNYAYAEKRGLYINDVLYVINTEFDIQTYNLNDNSFITSLEIITDDSIDKKVKK